MTAPAAPAETTGYLTPLALVELMAPARNGGGVLFLHDISDSPLPRLCLRRLKQAARPKTSTPLGDHHAVILGGLTSA